MPELTLTAVFDSLLGISDVNQSVDDLVLEGAINLMEKVGKNFEENINSTKNVDKRSEKDGKFKRIISRFEDLMRN